MINILFMSDILFHRLIFIQFGYNIHERYIIPQAHFIRFGYDIHERYIIPQTHFIQFGYNYS